MAARRAARGISDCGTTTDGTIRSGRARGVVAATTAAAHGGVAALERRCSRAILTRSAATCAASLTARAARRSISTASVRATVLAARVPCWAAGAGGGVRASLANATTVGAAELTLGRTLAIRIVGVVVASKPIIAAVRAADLVVWTALYVACIGAAREFVSCALRGREVAAIIFADDVLQIAHGAAVGVSGRVGRYARVPLSEATEFATTGHGVICWAARADARVETCSFAATAAALLRTAVLALVTSTDADNVECEANERRDAETESVKNAADERDRNQGRATKSRAEHARGRVQRTASLTQPASGVPRRIIKNPWDAVCCLRVHPGAAFNTGLPLSAEKFGSSGLRIVIDGHDRRWRASAKERV